MSYLQEALKVYSQEQIGRPKSGIRLVEKKAAPLTKGRQQTIEMLVNAVIANSLNEITKACNGNQFRWNTDIRNAEDNITLLYKKVMNGEGSLQDLLDVIKLWKELSLTENSIK